MHTVQATPGQQAEYQAAREIVILAESRQELARRRGVMTEAELDEIRAYLLARRAGRERLEWIRQLHASGRITAAQARQYDVELHAGPGLAEEI